MQFKIGQVFTGVLNDFWCELDLKKISEETPKSWAAKPGSYQVEINDLVDDSVVYTSFLVTPSGMRKNLRLPGERGETLLSILAKMVSEGRLVLQSPQEQAEDPECSTIPDPETRASVDLDSCSD